MNLKEELLVFVEQPSTYTDELLTKMLANIGSPDSELRDLLICNLFYAGIPTGEISLRQQEWLLEEILDKNLVLTGIDQEGDLVFTRTFSLLVLSLIVTSDSHHHFLSDKQFRTVFKLANDYLRTEQDTRGYVDEKGWAHGIAHGADLLVSLVSHPSFTQQMIPTIQLTIEGVLLRKTDPFTANEEGRLSQVMVAQLAHYSESGHPLILWLNDLKEKLKSTQKSLTNFEASQLERKLNQFSQALYFKLMVEQKQVSVSQQILELIMLDYQGV